MDVSERENKGCVWKGSQFPQRGTVRERERESERGNMLRLGLERRKAFFILLSSTGQLPTGSTADSIKRKVVGELT